MHVYMRSQQRGSAVVFRGFMFAESVERDWYSLMDGYVCQPDVPQDAWPGITLRRAFARLCLAPLLQASASRVLRLSPTCPASRLAVGC